MRGISETERRTMENAESEDKSGLKVIVALRMRSLNDFNRGLEIVNDLYPTGIFLIQFFFL